MVGAGCEAVVTTDPKATVVVNNYNYAPFLDQCIESALAQSYARTQVIVVDDGSTDDSRTVINKYAKDITCVFKANGGQASAFNAGFAAADADVIVFLDADDLLAETAVEQALRLFESPEVVKVHWPLSEIDRDGIPTGVIHPRGDLPAGNLRSDVLRHGPAGLPNPPTSGNAWKRSFLEQVLPMPERLYRTWADAYLQELAPLFGEMRALSTPAGFYRVHGDNAYATSSFENRLARGVTVYDDICARMVTILNKQGSEIDGNRLRQSSWFHRVQRATEEITSVVPQGETIILADQDEWGVDEYVNGRRCLPFVSRDGVYWGPPADDATAIDEIEKMRAAGAGFLVFAWPAFWLLDHYSQFARYLKSKWPSILNDDVLIGFDLRTEV